MYLMKQFAIKNQIKMKWIYLETGHGKGIADAIGATLKRKFDETVNFQPDTSFENAADLIKTVKISTNIKLIHYDKCDIEKLKKSLPKLETVKRTATFHEIITTNDGKLYSRVISNDEEKLLKVNF